MDDLKSNLPMAMVIAAFTGISWYIGVEINISLFLLFKRRRGLYFWSCALTSWGVILQPLFIILADFGVWKDPVPAVVMIYLTWLIMVVPQSWVLYSRLHLLVHTPKTLRILRYILIFVSIVFSVPTIIIGTIAQATNIHPGLASFNIVWDRVQLAVFFVQETMLSLLYIYHTRKYLLARSPLIERTWSVAESDHGERSQSQEQNSVLWQLVYSNVLIIALDITLLGIQCADLFYLQGAFKPCVYGVKLKIEFAILNRLIATVQQAAREEIYLGSAPDSLGLGPNLSSAQSAQERDRRKRSTPDPTETLDALDDEESDIIPPSHLRSPESQKPIRYETHES